MKRDVFISYKSSSLPLVEKLAELLEHNNILCWYAPRNLNEDGLGKEFDDEIVNAIKNTSAVIVLLNDLALTSKWVKRELTQAEKQGKLILPYVIEQLTVENGLSMRLESTHMIPAFPSPEDNFPVLLNSVQHLLGKTDVSSIKEDIPEDNTKPERASGGSDDPTIYDLDYEEGLAFLEADEEVDAFLAFLRSAETHNVKAYEYLFKILFKNSKTADFLTDETWENIEDLSDQGEGYADLLMHYRYYGMGTQNDIALRYLKRALNKQVSPYAFLQMGICYGWGLGVGLSDVQSKHYYLKAYEAGCWEATRYLAQMYLYGNEKTPIDITQAEKYAKEGAEKGVISCYEMLFRIYNKHDRLEEALQLAQYMVDNKIKGGYCLMGDYYLANEEDNETAKKWYVQGAEHNDKQAWGKLAYISWLQDDIEEAFRLASKGAHMNDSWAYYVLGFMYEEEGDRQDLDKAWESYMTQVHKFGTDASDAARLYLEKGYQPNESQLADLKHYLIIDSQQQRCDSIKALLKIILIEHGHEPVIDYESLHDMPDTILDYLRRGAEISQEDNSELQYIYGRLLLEDNGKYHDPFKGDKMMMSSALKGYTSAIQHVFDNNKDKEQLSELAATLIRTLNFVPEHLSNILLNGKDKVSDEELMSWLQKTLKTESQNIEWLQTAIDTLDDQLVFTRLRFSLYKTEMDAYKAMEQDVPSELISKIREDVMRNELGMSAMGYLNILGDYIPLIFPNHKNDDMIRFYRSVPYESISIYTNQPLEKPFFGYLIKGLDEELILDREIIPTGELRKSYQEMLDAYTDLATEGSVEVFDTQLTFQPTDYLPYCSLSFAIEHMRRAWRMLNAAKKAYGEHWQAICDNINNQSEILNIAEKMEGMPAAQLLLIEFVEVYIEAQSIIIIVNDIRSNIFKEDKAAVIKSLNEKIEGITKSEIKHHLTALPEDAEIPFM